MALKKTVKKTTTTTATKRSTGYGRLSTGTSRTAAVNNRFGNNSGVDNQGGGSNVQSGKFIRVTGLFETKTPGNLIGTTRQAVELTDGTIIPEGTTFLVMESKPYQGKTPSYPYSLVIPPPRG